MNTISNGWKKQPTTINRSLNKKRHSQRKHTRKNPTTKKRGAGKTVEFEPTSIDRMNQPVVANDVPFAAKKTSKFNNFRIQMYGDQRLCSTRGVVVTFIITIILIIAAGAAVGIVFATINSKSTADSGGNSNNNNNLISVPTVSNGLLTSSVSIGTQTGSACSGYTTINDPSRNYALGGSSSSCDNGPLFNTSNGGAWIRFVGTGGTTLSSSPAGTGHCGGFSTAWYNTTLPTVVGTRVNGTVCLETVADTCAMSIDTLVYFCTGNFYVYFLSPLPLCNARYCTA